jgi:uncharacterized protein YndB with AHSA1/START domain
MSDPTRDPLTSPASDLTDGLAEKPLRVSFTVACSAEHAFSTWTADISRWWPPDHTVTGCPAAIVIEPLPSGRIFERAADGTEHEWGRVRRWQPPQLLVYSWHLGRDAATATEVEVRFTPDQAGTRVDIEHRGWDAVTTAGGWRERTHTNWSLLYPRFADYAQEGTR